MRAYLIAFARAQGKGRKVDSFFKISERKSTVGNEIIGGLTTFLAMAYIIAVNPNMLVVAGVPFDAALTATCFGAAIMTIAMGLIANRPIALASGMGINAIVAYTLCLGGAAVDWRVAMAIVFLEGIVILILVACGLRKAVMDAIPVSLRHAIGIGIGLFIAFIGLKGGGIIVANESTILGLGDLSAPVAIVSLIAIAVAVVLQVLNVKGGLLISIVVATIVGIPLGVTTLNGIAAMPDFGDLGNVMFNLDFKGVFTASGLILVFVCFFGDFFSTLGTVLAVANRANMLDEHGNLPGIERPFLVDAIGTCIGALTGNTTITTFVESTSGVEAGGRTGLTALVAGIMFLLTIFLAPLFVAIPYAATGPALIYVGFLMLKGFTEIDFTDYDESIGPCVMMMFTAFTGNITNGLGAGIIVHVLVKLVRGKAKEIHPIMYLLCALMVLYFIVG